MNVCEIVDIIKQIIANTCIELNYVPVFNLEWKFLGAKDGIMCVCVCERACAHTRKCALTHTNAFTCLWDRLLILKDNHV